MKHTTPGTMKFKRLMRRLGESKRGVAGLLELLWITTCNNARRGDIGTLTNEEIAIECDWEGDPDELVHALVETGFVDQHSECRLLIHDWHEHAPNFIKGVVSKLGGFISPAPKVLDSPDPSAGPRVPDQVPDLGAGPSAPLPPNLTKPNQTKPNQTKAVCDASEEFKTWWERWLSHVEACLGRPMPTKTDVQLMDLMRLQDDAKAIAWIQHSIKVSEKGNLCDPHRYDKHPPDSEAAQVAAREKETASAMSEVVKRKRAAARANLAKMKAQREKQKNLQELANYES